MSITRRNFNQQCINFVLRCQNLTDNWSLNSDKTGQMKHEEAIETNTNDLLNSTLMLVKTHVILGQSNEIQSCEYNILYSESFEVPVMYFCLSRQDGSPLKLDDVFLRDTDLIDNDVGQMVSQVEHPILFRPFYMIHPCRTKNLMEPHAEKDADKYLICWLSTIGTVLNLKLNPTMAF